MRGKFDGILITRSGRCLWLAQFDRGAKSDDLDRFLVQSILLMPSYWYLFSQFRINMGREDLSYRTNQTTAGMNPRRQVVGGGQNRHPKQRGASGSLKIIYCDSCFWGCFMECNWPRTSSRSGSGRRDIGRKVQRKLNIR